MINCLNKFYEKFIASDLYFKLSNMNIIYIVIMMLIGLIIIVISIFMSGDIKYIGYALGILIWIIVFLYLICFQCR